VIGRPTLACLLLVALAGAAAAGPNASVGQRAHALSADLMSPYCPGRTLSDCPSPDAAVVRQEIRARLDAGQSEEEIRATLEARFGGALRGLPTSAVGWLGPIAILLLGAVALALALRRLSRREALGARAGAPPEIERALDAELERRGL
jgi:cytochrome c-type biogenesis protein CcmH